jgi:uncharacterized membrane protein YhaH (DUF805 family)
VENSPQFLPSRIGRFDYFLYCILALIIGIVLTNIFPPLMFLYWLGLKISLFILHIRRLHDLGIDGWWFVITMVPFIGGLMIIGLCLIPGDSGENEYGITQRINYKYLF